MATRTGTTNLGHTYSDGQLRDANGNVIAPGIDSTTAASLTAQLAVPKLRHSPSEEQIFIDHNGVTTEATYSYSTDSVQSGHRADLDADIAAANA